jgi:hypothetical protein
VAGLLRRSCRLLSADHARKINQTERLPFLNVAAEWMNAQGRIEEGLTDFWNSWDALTEGIEGTVETMVGFIVLQFSEMFNQWVDGWKNSINQFIKMWNSVSPDSAKLNMVQAGGPSYLSTLGSHLMTSGGQKVDHAEEVYARGRQALGHVDGGYADTIAEIHKSISVRNNQLDPNAPAFAIDKDQLARGFNKLTDGVSGVLENLVGKYVGVIPHIDFGTASGAAKVPGPDLDARGDVKYGASVGTFNSFAAGAGLIGTGVFEKQLDVQERQVEQLETISRNTSGLGLGQGLA